MSSQAASVSALLLHLVCCWLPVSTLVLGEQNRVVMESAKMEDQVSSASGYMYHSDSHGPPTYIHFSDTSSGGGSAAYLYPPTPLEHYTAHLPSHYNFELPLDHESYLQYVPKYHADTHYNSYGAPLIHDFEGYHHHYDDDHYDHHGGRDYESDHHASHGDKSSDSYNSLSAHDLGETAKFANQAQKSHYGSGAAAKASHHDLSKHHSAHHGYDRESEGGAFKRAKGRKKGTTTSGYHKIFNKDEFKKDHSFYDEADSRGRFSKYGDFHDEHGSEKGAHESAGDYDKEYHAKRFGKKGFYDKGRHSDRDLKHRKEKEAHSYEVDHDDYDKDVSHESGKGYKFKKGGGGYFKSY